MAGASWLVDSKRIATKIKSASASCDPRAVSWKSNPSRTCPRCHHVIDNSDVSQEWPGLPSGVKFDPSDQELLCHLLAKVGTGDARPHPFIDEFIPTLEGLDGICYTHPKELPGVKLDGSVSHFFHRTFKAYSTGTRKRRKIHNDTLGDVRWHKTGKTKPVVLDGIQQGCKKIMVLYMSTAKGGKPEKTNWVMHQYHLGTGEDEKDGEFVVSKVFYQQASKQNDSNVSDPSIELAETTLRKDEVVTVPKLATPEPPVEKRLRGLDSKQNDNNVSNHSIDLADTYLREDDDVVIDPKLATPEPPMENCSLDSEHESVQATKNCEMVNKDDGTTNDGENFDDHDNTDNHPAEDPKWWEGESQFLLDSQQLAEGIAICDEFLQSQSSYGGGGEEGPSKPSLSDYALMGVETLKKDLEECQKLPVLDNPDIGFDTPPDMRLSQLEFGSQDSFLAWGGAKVAD